MRYLPYKLVIAGFLNHPTVSPKTGEALERESLAFHRPVGWITPEVRALRFCQVIFFPWWMFFWGYKCISLIYAKLPESKDKEATENRDYYEYVEMLDISNVKSKDK